MQHHRRPAHSRRDRPAWKRLGRIIGVLIMGGLLQAAAASVPTNAESSASAGGHMFLGEMALQGTIAGHAEPLPPRMVACANCHQRDPGFGSGKAFAPALTKPGMTELISRRGGPPSMFSPASFCQMLRTGVDPAYVLVTRQMPRYAVSDDQCLGLWRHIMETSH